MSLNSISKIKKVLNKESCCGVGVKMCCSWNCCQQFCCQMMGIPRHKFWNKSFEERFVHILDILGRLHHRGDCNCAKIVTF
jgi:hypothetical protein